MVGRGRGAVLNVASTAAFQPFPGQASYAASKSFVLSYSQALRVELAGSGVCVTALCPGPVRTEFLSASGADEESFGKAVPSFLWESSLDVATAGLDGLASGKGVVIPGGGNRLGARLGHYAPRRLLLPVLARQHPALR